ncbi:hypothetical protein HYT52_04615 [Candidatus Woesearchaeota archaeon]|nr:hypothetical protein [Candidatus Woesearchaeota archaeon]
MALLGGFPMAIDLQDFTVTSVLDFIDVAMVIVVILIIYYLLRLLWFLLRGLFGGHGHGDHGPGLHPPGAHPPGAHPPGGHPPGQHPPGPGGPNAIVIQRVVPNSARQDQGRITIRVEGDHLDLLRRLRFPYHANPALQNLHLVSAIRGLTANQFEIDIDVSLDHAGNPTNLGMYDVVIEDGAGAEFRLDTAFEITAGIVPPPGGITITGVAPASHAQGTGGVTLTVTGTDFNLIHGNPVLHLHGNPADTLTINAYRLNTPTEFEIDTDITPGITIGDYDVVVQDAAGTEYRGDNLYEVTPPAVPPGGITITAVYPASHPQGAGIVRLTVLGTYFNLIYGVPVLHFHGHPGDVLVIHHYYPIDPTRFELDVEVDAAAAIGHYDVVVQGPVRTQYRGDNLYEVTPAVVPPPPPPGAVIRIDRVVPDTARQDEGVITLRVEGDHLDLLNGLHFPYHTDPTQQPLNMTTHPYNETPTSFEVDVNVSLDHHGNPTNLGMYDVVIADVAGTDYRLDDAFEITAGSVPPPGGITITAVTPTSYPQGMGIVQLTVTGTNLHLIHDVPFIHLHGNPADGLHIHHYNPVDATTFEIYVDIAGTSTVGNYDIVVQDAAGTEYRGDNLFEVTAGAAPGPEFTLSIIVQRRIDGVRIPSHITINGTTEYVKDGFIEYKIPAGKYRITSKPEDTEYKPMTKIVDVLGDKTVEFVHDKKTDLKRNLGFLFEIAHYIESVLLVELERQSELQRNAARGGEVNLDEARKLIRDLKGKLTRAIDLGILAFERFPPQDDTDRNRIKQAIGFIYSMRQALEKAKFNDKEKRDGLAPSLEEDPYLALKLERVIKMFRKFSRGLNGAEKRVDTILNLIKREQDGRVIVINGTAREIFGESPVRYFREERREKDKNRVKIGAAIRKKVYAFNTQQSRLKTAEDSGDIREVNAIISQMVKRYRDEMRRARTKGNTRKADELQREIDRLNTRRR